MSTAPDHLAYHARGEVDDPAPTVPVVPERVDGAGFTYLAAPEDVDGAVDVVIRHVAAGHDAGADPDVTVARVIAHLGAYTPGLRGALLDACHDYRHYVLVNGGRTDWLPSDVDEFRGDLTDLLSPLYTRTGRN